MTPPVQAQTAGPTPVCDSAQQCTVTFDHTGGLQQWTAPANTVVVTVTMYGAQGGTAQDGAVGGLGAEVAFRTGVVPGHVYQVAVGTHPRAGQTDVYGGGGNDGSSGYGCNLGGPGGGASRFLDPNGVEYAVAGGGGGGGGHGYGSESGQGGAGGASGAGGTTGQTVTGGTVLTDDVAGGGEAGGGASTTGGGYGGPRGVGSYDPNPEPAYGGTGVAGRGGAGDYGMARDCANLNGASAQGGGGGGGYFGGGGGGAGGEYIKFDTTFVGGGGGGGGGGSSHVGEPDAIRISQSEGVRAGNGQVVIAYSTARPTFLGTYTTTRNTTVGEPVSLFTVVEAQGPEVTGTVTFLADGVALGTAAVGTGGRNVATLVTTALRPGTHAITSSYSGDANFQAANQEGHIDVIVAAGTQEITYTSTPPPDAAVGGPGYTPTATGGASGNPVTFSIDPASTGVCTLTAAQVVFTGAGTCTIDADQAGTDDHTAAPRVQQAVAVAPGTQAITVTSGSPTAAVVDGPTYTPTATGGASGNAVTFSVDPTSTGVCTLTSGEVSFTGAGTCTVNADQAGTTDYTAAPQVQQSTAVGRGGQAITFTSPAPTGAVVDGPGYTPTATGGASGSPVTFTVDPASTGVCTLTAGQVVFTGAGTCTVDADQAGTDDYTAAGTAQQSTAVGPGRQATTFTSPAPADAVVDGPGYTPTTTGGPSGNPVTLTVDPASAGACQLDGGEVVFTGAGTCLLNADQAGTDDYTAATRAQQAISVGRGAQVTAFSSAAPTDAVVDGPGYTPTATGGASASPVVLTVDPASAAVCTLTDGIVTFTGVGTCVLDADQAGTDDYTAAPRARQVVTVGPGSQTVTFTSDAPGGAVVGGAGYTPTATGGSSGRPVLLTVDPSSAAACTLTDGRVAFTAVGTCTLTATQAGTADYTAAAPVQQRIVVGAAPAAAPDAVAGSPLPAPATAGSSGRSGPLASTGGPARELAALGAGLLTLGVLASTAGRRRRD